MTMRFFESVTTTWPMKKVFQTAIVFLSNIPSRYSHLKAAIFNEFLQPWPNRWNTFLVIKRQWVQIPGPAKWPFYRLLTSSSSFLFSFPRCVHFLSLTDLTSYCCCPRIERGNEERNGSKNPSSTICEAKHGYKCDVSEKVGEEKKKLMHNEDHSLHGLILFSPKLRSQRFPAKGIPT